MCVGGCMSRRNRVVFDLDSGDVESLPIEDIKAILRAADDIIAVGGRNLLCKILKGSREKKVLEYELNKNPCYGYYNSLTLKEISYRVDWIIRRGYLNIEYFGRLPMIVYSETGWEIERETFVNELLSKLYDMLDSKDFSFIKTLKGRNRGMILMLLDAVKNTGNARFIPVLKTWKENDFKKVQSEIQKVIDHLRKSGKIF